MPTRLYTHDACLDHDPGPFHPERPERLRAVLAALDGEDFALLERAPAPRASREQLARVHRPAYVDAILDNVPEQGQVHLDPDTAMSPGSGEAALRAAGAVCAAVGAVVRGEARNAFCAVRPPGHHAEAARAMGFCLFNNLAVGALEARVAHGLKRIAAIDFDVHHGNGTQSAFEGDADLFYASSHQSPCYPGTGSEAETGIADNVVNAELRPGAGSAEFRHAYKSRILPALDVFAPELILISAGFDAHARDPLAQLRLEDDDYGWVTSEIAAVAERRCQGRIVSTLEGGYDLEALAASAAQHARALMGR